MIRKQTTQLVSDESVTSVDEQGNLITTRTIVTSKSPEQVQLEANQVDAQIANLQAKKDTLSATLSSISVRVEK